MRAEEQPMEAVAFGASGVATERQSLILGDAATPPSPRRRLALTFAALGCAVLLAGLQTTGVAHHLRTGLRAWLSKAEVAPRAARPHGARSGPPKQIAVLATAPQGFQPVDGGVDRACGSTTTSVPDSSSASFMLQAQVTSMHDCQALCEDDLRCTGVEFKSATSECRVWTHPIGGSTAAAGAQCMKREFPGFRLADGSLDRACGWESLGDPLGRNASGASNVSGWALVRGAPSSASPFTAYEGTETLYECQAHCVRATACAGIEFDLVNRWCRVSAQAVIGTKPVPGLMCLQYTPPVFNPVNGGRGQACIQHDGGESDAEFRFPPQNDTASLDECHARCERAAVCTGFQHRDGRCTTFTKPVVGSEPADGSVCLRRDPAGFVEDMVNGSRDLACRSEDETKEAHDEGANRSLHQCKTGCARSSFCEGIEFREETGQCHLYMHPMGASVPLKGSRCLRLQRPVASSLFCFALMQPDSTESELLAKQLEARKSIFACDEAMVYSNPIQNLQGVKTGLIDMDLHCEFGGPPGLIPTVLNRDIFIKVWETVIEDGYFRAHDWTVKVDPDAVFLPERLRQILSSVPQSTINRGMFLKNCKLGLHGPIEVISRKALEMWAGQHWSCQTEETPQEDAYMEACLKQIGVLDYMQINVLAEGECMRGDFVANPTWWACNSSHATFHPMKTEINYFDCLTKAENSEFALQ